jgi:DNA-binding NarL/FixJ family response regulator
VTDPPREAVKQPVRVVIAEDSGLLREGLSRLLADAGFEVVAAVGDGPGLVAAAEEHRPDVAVVDVRMPPGYRDEGLRAAIEARGRVPGLPVLVLSQYVEERYGAELLESGAHGTGYLLKDRVADVPEFAAAVRDVASGGTVLDPEVVEQLLSRRRHGGLSKLSPREREVLDLLVDGLAIAQIARRLYISESTAKTHVANIYEKLGAGNRAQAVMAAVRLGLVDDVKSR